jgi:ATP-dependent RNA helicase RhlE
MQFSDLSLAPELMRAIQEQGYTEPTPVQQQAIPSVLLGRDIRAAAQTGTGKTASFTLPMLQRLKPLASTSVSPARHPVRALILTPTRELAAQVQESVKVYGKFLTLRSTVVYGGVPIDPQIAELRKGVEILVATPGRLLDHLQSKTVNLSTVEILVLDEADRMLDMGFLPDIKRILATLPAKRQNLLFSATYSDEMRRLADQLLTDPVVVEVAARNTVAEMVTHKVYAVESADKRDLLTHLIRSRDMRQVLVFSNTKLGANRLVYNLVRNDIGAEVIHSDKNQTERMQSLADFKDGKIRVLVATDIAARGLDIEQLPFVINFDLPYNAEDYVHRIGRTGRAGTSGEAISLMCPEEREALAAIEKLVKLKLPFETVAPMERSRDSDRAHRPARSRREHGRDSGARSGTSGSRAPAPVKQMDPLFSQPYQPAHVVESSVPAKHDSGSISTSRSGKPAQQVAALFLPPTRKSA